MPDLPAQLQEARDLKYDRLVDLKVMRPEVAAMLGAERFPQEIRITARLDHLEYRRRGPPPPSGGSKLL